MGRSVASQRVRISCFHLSIHASQFPTPFLFGSPILEPEICLVALVPNTISWTNVDKISCLTFATSNDILVPKFELLFLKIQEKFVTFGDIRKSNGTCMTFTTKEILKAFRVWNNRYVFFVLQSCSVGVRIQTVSFRTWTCFQGCFCERRKK